MQIQIKTIQIITHFCTDGYSNVTMIVANCMLNFRATYVLTCQVFFCWNTYFGGIIMLFSKLHIGMTGSIVVLGFFITSLCFCSKPMTLQEEVDVFYNCQSWINRDRADYNDRSSATQTTHPKSQLINQQHMTTHLPLVYRRGNELPENKQNTNDIENVNYKVKGDITSILENFNTREHKYHILRCQLRVGNTNLSNNLYSKS